MRITYRFKIIKIIGRCDGRIYHDSSMENLNVYPLKLEAVIKIKMVYSEAGCGAGRILNYYHSKGYKIKGIDFIDSVINRLRNAETADIKSCLSQIIFLTMFLVGLYHNLKAD